MANILVQVILSVTITFLIFGKSLSVSAKKRKKGMQYYFAYDDDLLGKSMYRLCPNAIREDTGNLTNYKLEFKNYSNKWKGALATATPTSNNADVIWGAIWKIQDNQAICLNKKKKDGYPTPGAVRVNQIPCAFFSITAKNSTAGLPSKVYVDTIVRGAKESNLPEDYQMMLQTIPNNGYDGKVDYDSK